MHSVLSRASRQDVVLAPFPHLVLEEALPSDYYQLLAAEFPKAELILGGREPLSNKNYRVAASDIVDDERFSRRWREFVEHHVSAHFFHEVRELFGTQLRHLSSKLERDVGKSLDDWTTGIRFRNSQGDVALECQFTYTAPVEAPSRSIGPHVDREVALYAGLLYFRDDSDDSTGGDLELYEFRSNQPVFEPQNRLVRDEDVACFRKVRYAANTLVFFLHSPWSVHGVTARSVTRFPRRHVNFVGEIGRKAFDISPYVRG